MWWSRKPAILVKGTVADRPWAATLAAIGSSGLNGELALHADGMDFRIAFANGQIVGAASPLPSDTLQRIALTTRVVSATNVAAATRIVGRHDHLARFTDAAGLVGDAAVQFKRRVIVQRAARTFAAERGTYVVSDRITIPVLDDEVDVRAAIFHGMRANQSELRLSADLRALGARFLLYPEAAGDVERFEFDAEAAPILVALRGGTSAAEIEAQCRELDPRLIYAVLGSLAASRVITPIDERTPSTLDVSISRAPTPREPTISRVPTPRDPTSSSSVPLSLRHGPPATPRPAGSAQPRRAPGTLSRVQVEQLLASRVALLGAGVDLFTFLGVPFDAPVAHVRAAYAELVRDLRPDRLAELGIHEHRHQARAVFARAVLAMAVLTDDVRRASYVAEIARTQRI